MTQTVLITGANRGLGLSLAKKFLSENWRVIATCRDPKSAQELSGLSGDIEVHALDVADENAVAVFATSIESQTVDVLLNNAGVMGGERQSFADMDYAAWRETLEVNTLAPLRMAQAVLPSLKRSSNPKIITITSQMGSLNRPGRSYYAYRSSKAAVNMVMKTLALDLSGDNIIVALFHPGWVKTDMGGPNAEISAADSAKGIYDSLISLKLKDSGRFLQWNGKDHPW